MPIARLSAVEMAAGIAAGELSSEALVATAINSVETHNSSINAFCQLHSERALEEARAVDVAVASGRQVAPMAGVPVAVKDLTDMAGTVTERGSLLYRGKVTTGDSPIVARLKQSGAIVIGKTTTPEFGWKGGSTSPLYGVTRNPWNPALTSGGSSSGAGSALAARLVPMALGSDAGGSVRIPAGFCGVFALKGTLGRIANAPLSATEMLTCCGPMSVTVADSAAFFDLFKGPDPADHLSLPDDGLCYRDLIATPPRGLKIAFAPTLFGVPVDPRIARVVSQAMTQVASDLEVTVETVTPPWSDPFEAFETLWVAGRGATYAGIAAGHESELDPGFARIVAEAPRYGVADWLAAMRQRAAFTSAVSGFLQDWDLLVTPTLPVLPFKAEDDLPAEQVDRDSPVAWARWTPFTYPFNLSGHPAASLPAGFTDEGLPVGLQVIGPRFADGRVLQFAAAVEALRPWRQRLPKLIEAA